MEEDFPVEVKDLRRKLYPIMKEAKRQGMKSHINGYTLVISGKEYTVDTISKLPPGALTDAKKACRRDGMSLAFFHKECPLSNHHPAPFTYEQVRYSCSEQFIKRQEALLFNDVDAANDIMTETVPGKMMQRAKSIEGYQKDIWTNNIKKLCSPGILAKFQQNPECAQFLVETGDRRIGEAARNDPVWGIGIGLQDKELFTKVWAGQNLLGSMLEEVRKKLTAPAMDETAPAE